MVVPSFYQKGASVADVHHRRRNKLTTSPASEDEKGGTQAEENVFQEDKSQMNSSLVEYDLSKLDPYLNPIQKVRLIFCFMMRFVHKIYIYKFSSHFTFFKTYGMHTL